MLRALARSKRPPEGRVPRACVAARVAIQVLTSDSTVLGERATISRLIFRPFGFATSAYR